MKQSYQAVLLVICVVYVGASVAATLNHDAILSSENAPPKEVNGTKQKLDSHDLLVNFIVCREECRAGVRSCVSTNCLTDPLTCLDTCVLHYDLCTFAKGCGSTSGPSAESLSLPALSIEHVHEEEDEQGSKVEGSQGNKDTSPELRSSNKFCIRFG